MGEYHEKHIRSRFKSDAEYQDYKDRKLRISWKETVSAVFSGVYHLENLIDEKGAICKQDKEDILDFL